MRKIKSLYLFIAGVTAVCGLTGCSSSEEENVAEAELPYGATMITDSECGEVPITYDRRFITAEEAAALSGYFYALESKDEELLDKYTPDVYTDFVIEALYQDLLGMDGLVVDMNSKFAAEENVPYEIKEVEIKSFYTEDNAESTDLANLYNMLAELSGEEDFMSRITDGQFITYDIRTDTGGTIKSFEDQTLFLIRIDGEYSVCS
ncbi:MAG: hypothetical protein IJY74_06030 [Oscillospiraceae bacterium]|nr:hypothetical protein [Oscillospiraceae bacterium]